MSKIRKAGNQATLFAARLSLSRILRQGMQCRVLPQT